MAKSGILGGQAPRPTTNGTPGGVRPMPNPRLNPATVPVAGQGGFFGPRGSEGRYDMAKEMLALAMQSAGGSGSPLLAGLAPLLGVAIGGRMDKVRDDAKAAEVAQMTEGLLGPGGLSPSAKEALAIMENENAPDYLKALAKKQFDEAMAPVMGGGSGGSGASTAPRRRRGGSKSSGTGGGTGTKPRVKLYGEYDIGGVLHGRDPYGQMVPYTDPSGKPVSTGKGGAPSPAAPATPAPPPDPVMPSDPTGGLASPGGASGGLTDDELLLKYGG